MAGDGNAGAAGHCASLAPGGFPPSVAMALTTSRPKADALRDADPRDDGAKPKVGAERLRGELLKLGIRVSKRTVQRYMKKRVPASMACITTTEGRRDTPRVVWMEKVANTTNAGLCATEPRNGFERAVSSL